MLTTARIEENGRRITREKKVRKVRKRVKQKGHFPGEGEAFIPLILCRRSRPSLQFDSGRRIRKGKRRNEEEREGESRREKETVEKVGCAQKMALTVNPISFCEN